MIHVNGEEFILKWTNGVWRDRAGHVWGLDPKSGALTSPEHGTFSELEYKIVPMELEETNGTY